MHSFPAEQCFRYLAEILGTLRSTNQHEKVLHLVVDRIVRLTHCQTCAIVLIDPTTEYLGIDNAHNLSLTFCNSFRRKIATATIGELLWTGKPILLHGDEPDRVTAEEIALEHPVTSCACVQISVDHRALGYVHIDSRERHAFSADHLELLQIFGDIAGLALNKSRMYEENLHLERFDKETGLEKYVPFLERVHGAVARGKEFNETFALLLLDVDNFKEIVKTFGYDVSRQLLKEMATTLRGHLRPIDGAGRFGFDEFILLLENTDLVAGQTIARQYAQVISTSPYTPQAIRSTVSIGVAAFPQSGQTSMDLLRAAKSALFEAQRGGRNGVFAFAAETASAARASRSVP